MKKVIIPIIVIVVIILGYFIYSYYSRIPKPMSELCDLTVSQNTKIHVMDGSGKEFNITDKGKINELFSILKEITAQKQFTDVPAGWTFSFTKYENEKEVFKITLGGHDFVINGPNKGYYRADRNDVIKRLEAYLQQVRSISETKQWGE